MAWTRRKALLAGAATAGASALGWRARTSCPVPERSPLSRPPGPVQPPTAAPVAGRAPYAGMHLAHIHDAGRRSRAAPCRRPHEARAKHGVQHVVLTPFAYLPAVDSVRLRWGELDRTLTIEGLLTCAADIRALGMRPVLKPHIWCSAFWSGGASRQDILPDPAAGGWEAWFEQYTAFIVDQARLARQMDAALLVVGLEYLQATLDAPGAWADVARACRTEFAGPLTYAANWWKEVEQFSDWSAFDVVGVNAYFPLDVPPDADAPTIARAWAPHLGALSAIAETTGKSVVFTEAGVPAILGAAREPWNAGFSGTPDPTLPERYVEGLLRAAAPQPWFRGVFWWKWFTDVSTRGPWPESDPYDLSGTTAPARLRAWWHPPSP